ncbi:hypothetical protein AB0N93_10195 [Streptomyces sp. NPDC091267]
MAKATAPVPARRPARSPAGGLGGDDRRRCTAERRASAWIFPAAGYNAR